MTDWTPEQLAYILQFHHPEKMLAGLPGVRDETIAPLFGISLEQFRAIRARFADQARQAAAGLLAEPDFARRVAALPFAAGQTIVTYGDSITDDLQSWSHILAAVLAAARPDDGLRVVNWGFSGDTTSQLISRFLNVVLESPAWIICLAGTNDCRLHGLKPAKLLVSPDESVRNYRMLRNFAATQTAAKWVWMTPPGIIEEKIAAHWFLGPMQMMWRNRDLAVLADLLRERPDPVVDLAAVFGEPANPDLLLDDGLHPSLAGQQAIVRALVETLTA